MNQQFYQVGGSLPSNSKSYIKREADDILYKYLKENKYCYVLNARQVGKSSLRVHTSKKLEKEGYSCVNIDLTSIGGSENIETYSWYLSFVFEIIQQLDLDLDKFSTWWEKHEKLTDKLTVVKLFGEIFDEIVLQDPNKKIIIFIDELDSILGMRQEFSADDFFAVIRTFYNLRSEDERYNQVAFALFGVATPEDLMRDSARTPFNIAHSIKLNQFKLSESLILVEGLVNNSIDSQKILEKIFEWTSGTPYLTQKILDYISQNPISLVKEVDNIVNKLFLEESFKETNISNILTRIISNDKYNVKMLYIINELIAKKTVKADDSHKEQIYLKLSGLAKEEKEKLLFSNKIYEKVFNKTWLDATMEKIDRPLSKDLQRWMELDKNKSALLKGKVLDSVKEWAKSRDDLTNIENTYLRLSVQEEQESVLNEEKRKGQSKIIKLLIPTLILVSLLGYYLYKNSDKLEKEKNRNLYILESLKKISPKENKSLDIKPLKKDEDEYEYESAPIPKNMYDNSVIDKIKIDTKKDSNDTVTLVIPDETQEKFPLLVKLIRASRSMNNSERNYWFQVLPLMTEPQQKELFNILKTEMIKLKEIDLKYSKMEEEAKKKNNIKYIFYDVNMSGRINDIVMDSVLLRMDNITSNIKHTAYKDFLNTIKLIETREESKDKYYHLLAKFYFRVKEYDEALVEGYKSIKINDKNADVYFTIGEVYHANKNFDDAIRFYQKALMLINPLVKKSLTKENLKKQLKFSEKIITVLEKSEKYQEAITYINKQVSFIQKNKKILFGNDEDKYNNELLVLYNRLGWNYNKNGNFKQSIKLYEKAIVLNPKKDYLYRNMAITYRENKQYEKAIEMHNKSIELNHSSDNYFYLAYTYSMQKDLINAIRFYTKSLDKNDKCSSCYLNIFEFSVVENIPFDGELEKKFFTINKDKKEYLIYYDMMKIFKNIASSKKVDLNVWSKKYSSNQVDWDFFLTDGWIKTIKDKEVKKKLLEATKVFKNHNKEEK